VRYILTSLYANHDNAKWRNILNAIGMKKFSILSTDNILYNSVIPDYILFDGGPDVYPLFYNEDNKGLSRVWLERDLHELGLFTLYKNYPVAFIGICRGAQFLNVVLGGTLHQDIVPKHDHYHHVTVKDSSICNYLQDVNFLANSLHHQACNELGNNLIPTLLHTDYNTIEGFESTETIHINGKDAPKYKAIQAHPEYFDSNFKYSQEVLRYLFSL